MRNERDFDVSFFSFDNFYSSGEKKNEAPHVRVLSSLEGYLRSQKIGSLVLLVDFMIDMLETLPAAKNFQVTLSSVRNNELGT